ncbi:hypothetical protein [Catenulispora rubra]|uniref:hypothetical protein n=1 Tax=Catenulispora rubra TaxID=280293 RepID=UPI0018926DA5|nr:hypothetical protein [Catenulispora rubra]
MRRAREEDMAKILAVSGKTMIGLLRILGVASLQRAEDSQELPSAQTPAGQPPVQERER